MGIYAVRSAYLVAADRDLGHPATRLLVYMAMIALDKPDDTRAIESCLFWQGRAAQAIALGARPDEAESTAATSAVKRAMSELRKKEVVELLKTAHLGQRSVYFLRLNSEMPTVELTPSRLRKNPPPESEEPPTSPQRTAERSPVRPLPRRRSLVERVQSGREVYRTPTESLPERERGPVSGPLGGRSAVPIGDR